MPGTGIFDASGVLDCEVGRNYVGGVPNPVDRDLLIQTDIRKSNHTVNTNFSYMTMSQLLPKMRGQILKKPR